MFEALLYGPSSIPPFQPGRNIKSAPATASLCSGTPKALSTLQTIALLGRDLLWETRALREP